MTLKFKELEAFKQEHEIRGKAHEEYVKREHKAMEALTALTSEYEAKITESIASGKDVSGELDALDVKIGEAKALYDRRKSEVIIARTKLPQPKTKRMDVVHTFREVYAKEVQESIMPDVNERMKLARELILSAVLDYHVALEDYRDITDDVKDISSVAHKNGESNAHFHVSNPVEATGLNFSAFMQKLVDDANEAVTKLVIPQGVTYIANTKGGK